MYEELLGEVDGQRESQLTAGWLGACLPWASSFPFHGDTRRQGCGHSASALPLLGPSKGASAGKRLRGIAYAAPGGPGAQATKNMHQVLPRVQPALLGHMPLHACAFGRWSSCTCGTSWTRTRGWCAAWCWTTAAATRTCPSGWRTRTSSPATCRWSTRSPRCARLSTRVDKRVEGRAHPHLRCVAGGEWKPEVRPPEYVSGQTGGGREV